MRIRNSTFYSIICSSKNCRLSLDVDADSSKEVVSVVEKAFKGRWQPPKDENGLYRKGQPYTHLKILCVDKSTDYCSTITHGNVYSLTPSQVINHIKDTIST